VGLSSDEERISREGARTQTTCAYSARAMSPKGQPQEDGSSSFAGGGSLRRPSVSIALCYRSPPHGRQPILFVGRVADVGESMWSSARLESSYVQAKPSMPSIGFSITVMAEVVDGGRFVGGSLIIPLR
jgi:hypothetical protein